MLDSSLRGHVFTSLAERLSKAETTTLPAHYFMAVLALPRTRGKSIRQKGIHDNGNQDVHSLNVHCCVGGSGGNTFLEWEGREWEGLSRETKQRGGRDQSHSVGGCWGELIGAPSTYPKQEEQLDVKKRGGSEINEWELVQPHVPIFGEQSKPSVGRWMENFVLLHMPVYGIYIHVWHIYIHISYMGMCGTHI